MRFHDLISIIKDDLRYRNSSSLLKGLNIYLTSPSFRLILNYRIGSYLHRKTGPLAKFIRKRYRYIQVTKRNCQISYSCQIGRNVDFRHPIGIVIGDGVKIGDNVKIWHNVTIGSHGKANEDLGYPTIEKNVRIYEGATIIGKIVIGENSLIGSKSLVNKDVPQDSTAFGIPAKIKFNANLS